MLERSEKKMNRQFKIGQKVRTAGNSRQCSTKACLKIDFDFETLRRINGGYDQFQDRTCAVPAYVADLVAPASAVCNMHISRFPVHHPC